VNIFGQIDPILISKKLGITLSNLPQDWREELIESMGKEIYYREYDIRKYNDFPTIAAYNTKKIVEHKNFLGILNRRSKNHLIEIANNLICISVEDFENSMLKKRILILIVQLVKWNLQRNG